MVFVAHRQRRWHCGRHPRRGTPWFGHALPANVVRLAVLILVACAASSHRLQMKRRSRASSAGHRQGASLTFRSGRGSESSPVIGLFRSARRALRQLRR
jgi:hypothetical protein